jgi:hypothetical protein
MSISQCILLQLRPDSTSAFSRRNAKYFACFFWIATTRINYFYLIAHNSSKHQRSEPSIHFLIYVLAFVDPVMHCALVIVISQYVHFEEWRNIIINIINVADNSSYHFTNNAHDAKYICTEDITTLQLHCLVLCNIKFLCSWKQNISSMF